MKTTQGLGWLAAGVVALGLNGFYHDGGLQLAHQVVDRITDRSAAVVALASEQSNDLLAKVESVSAQDQTRSCPLAFAAARVQAHMNRVQARLTARENARAAESFTRFEAMSDRQQARLEAKRARMETQVARFHLTAFNPVMVQVLKGPAFKTPVCARMKVTIPQPDLKGLAPSVRIGTGGTGPI